MAILWTRFDKPYSFSNIHDLFHMHLYFSRETKDVRSLAALGVIYVVKTSWLEDCDRQKKQVPVRQGHIAYDLLLPKGMLLWMFAFRVYYLFVMFKPENVFQLIHLIFHK